MDEVLREFLAEAVRTLGKGRLKLVPEEKVPSSAAAPSWIVAVCPE
jgi:hypothetical protein